MFVSTFWLDSELGVEIRKGCKTNSCSCFNESPEISFGYLQCSKALKKHKHTITDHSEKYIYSKHCQ